MNLRTSENPVLSGCLLLLSVRGVFAWRNNNVAVYDPAIGRYRKHVGLPGVADILGILPGGRLLAIETKAPAVPAIGRRAGQLRPDQRAFLAAVNDLGGVGVCTSDVARLASVLDTLAADPRARFNIKGEVIE